MIPVEVHLVIVPIGARNDLLTEPVYRMLPVATGSRLIAERLRSHVRGDVLFVHVPRLFCHARRILEQTTGGSRAPLRDARCGVTMRRNLQKQTLLKKKRTKSEEHQSSSAKILAHLPPPSDGTGHPRPHRRQDSRRSPPGHRTKRRPERQHPPKPDRHQESSTLSRQ